MFTINPGVSTVDNEGDSENKPYSVGKGRPPLQTRWKPGGPSPNPFGRPTKLKRLPLPRQRYIDILQVVEAPVEVNGEMIPFAVVNVELIKRKAMQGHAPSQRHIDRIYREALLAVQLLEPGLSARVDELARRPREGDPLKFVIGGMNVIADELTSSHVDSSQDPKETRRQIRKGSRKSLKRATRGLIIDGYLTEEEAQVLLQKFDAETRTLKLK